MAVSRPLDLKSKNKTTLLSSTFKIEEKKVVLFFGFKAQGPRYGRFLVFNDLC